MGSQRLREGVPAGPDSGPATAARVAGLLQTRSPAEPRTAGARAGMGNAALARAHAISVQPKLSVSHPDDALEREAEAFSAAVVSRTPRRTSREASGPVVAGFRPPDLAGRAAAPAPSPPVSRDEAPATEGPAVDMSGADVGRSLEAFITGISGGDPLVEAVRARIEPVLGVDLTGVRVHADPKSAAAAAELQARAFTFGRDIFLAAGESASDLALMAHEATHVVQQGAVEVYREDGEEAARPDAMSTDRQADLGRAAGVVHRDDSGDSDSWLMGPIKAAAQSIPGYLVLSQIIGEDPLTGDPVSTGRAEFVQALLAYGPFSGAVGPVLQGMEALDEIFTMIVDRLATHDLMSTRISRDIDAAWDEISLIDGIDPNVAIVTRYVDAVIADVRSFVTAVVDELITAVKAAAIAFARPLVQRPEIKPYWDLGTKVFGYDPLTGEAVSVPTVEILADFLRLIGRESVVAQMQERGTLQQTADWLDTQVATFTDLYGQTRALVTDVIDALSPANLADLLTNVSSIADRAVALLQQLRTFADTVIGEVLRLVKKSLLGTLSEYATQVPGFTLLTVILEKDPFTERPVARTAENLIKGFILLLPNGEQMYAQLAESGAIGGAAGRIESEMTRLNISWDLITGTFTAIWDGLSLDDLLDPIGAFQRIVDQFGEPLGRIIEFAATVIQVVVELILTMMHFPSELLGNIVAHAMAAIDDIKRDPVGFLQNLIEALKEGVSGFFDNIGPYLLDGLVDWLFRGLRSLGIQPPESLSLESVITMVVQVVGVTEETLWKKLADRTSPETVQKIRGAIELAGQAFSFIGDVQERGITAIWEFLQGQLSSLWDTILSTAKNWIMSEIVDKVVTRLLSMLDPTGVMAVIRSAQAFFNAIQSAIEYINEILQIVDRYVSTIGAIAQGDVTPGAAMLENGLASAISIAIGFLANQIGLSNVPEKIHEIILGLRELIDQALDWLFDQAVRLGQAALGALRVGGGVPSENLDIDQPLSGVSAGHRIANDGAGGRLMFHSADVPIEEAQNNHDELGALYKNYIKAEAAYKQVAASMSKPPTADESNQLELTRLAVLNVVEQIKVVASSVRVVDGATDVGPECFEQISSAMAVAVIEPGPRRGIEGAVRDAEEAGLIGANGMPGAAAVGTQPHRNATQARAGIGVSGKTHQSAHIVASGFASNVADYSRSGALTVIMSLSSHRAFDSHWAAWVRAQRRPPNNKTSVTAVEMQVAMHAAIAQIPKPDGMHKDDWARTVGTLSWMLDIEMEKLQMTGLVRLPKI